MALKGRRRLEILVPEDHPIFLYPAGVRSAVAREWMDIGSRLSGIDKNINEIKEKINKLENKPDCEADEKQNGFDAVAFADNIEKVFG
jgi:hypothetical protein